MIRKAKDTIEDRDAIYKLVQSAAATRKVLPRSNEEIKKAIHGFYVYEENKKIVGCCALEIYSQKMAEVRSLVVDPNYQGKNIGRQLVNACVAEAKEKKIYEVLAITDKDMFFEKMGFSKCLNGQWPMFLKP
jgi:amino-acid N-acetyltransferase